MANTASRFFLQAIDPDYGCPVIEAMFEVEHLPALQALLGPCADDDAELRHSYSIDADELAAITCHFNVVFDAGGREVSLRRWHTLRAAPYLVHTGYELFLLVEGRKQLAREVELYPPHHHGNEHLFDRFVGQGVLSKQMNASMCRRPPINPRACVRSSP